MKSIKLTEFSQQSQDLFSEARQTFSRSANTRLQSMSGSVPERFVDENKKVRIVFAGQYSAGKSSILSIMTGQQLKVGQGITTSECRFLDWNGIELVDTPGIHTQKRPDHDKITYDAMAEADLIVFVLTVEGFSTHLGNHFRKLLIDKGRGNEIMLVINKMESSEYGNTEEGRRVLLEKDIIPVISPEYTADDLFISYIDTNAYLDAQNEEGPLREEYLKMSGYEEFYENINRFVSKKRLLGKCTTSLFMLQQMLSEALGEFKSGDICADGSIEILNKQRRMLVEAKDNIRVGSYSIVREHTQKVRGWGYEIASGLTFESVDKVNIELEKRYNETDSVYLTAAKELKDLIGRENESLKKKIGELQESEFAINLRSVIDRVIIKLKKGGNKDGKFGKMASEAITKSGQKISKFATGPKAQSGWKALFKLGNSSGSEAHKAILEWGKQHNKSFKPWEAVKIADKIEKFGKALGVAGALVGVILQFKDDYDEKKREQELLNERSRIRSMFFEAANEIDKQFDNDTRDWIANVIDTKIKDIDGDIRTIGESMQIQEEEYLHYQDLFQRTRTLIDEIQASF